MYDILIFRDNSGNSILYQTELLSDPTHPYFGPIVGRYANRIKNGMFSLGVRDLPLTGSTCTGTFSIPITKDPQPPGPDVYQIPTNEHNGKLQKET